MAAADLLFVFFLGPDPELVVRLRAIIDTCAVNVIVCAQVRPRKYLDRTVYRRCGLSRSCVCDFGFCFFF